MRRYQLIRRKVRKAYFSLLYSLFCILLLLSDKTTYPRLGLPQSTSPLASTHPSLSTTGASGDESEMNADTVVHIQHEKARTILQTLSLEQKLGQMLMVEYLGNSYQGSGLHYMLTQQFVGSFMYQQSNHNFDPPDDEVSQVRSISTQAMKDAQLPPLIATDQEGGLVNRLSAFHGDQPSAQDMAASGDPRLIQQQGSQTARWLIDLGINADLAPVVDVQSVDPPILASRMFGRDPQMVASYAGAFLEGLQTSGVAGCLKHFPGLGAITSDPHDGLPIVRRSRGTLERIDLTPYRLLLQQQHPAMIMTTDILVPAIDPILPAELSPTTITGILRGELGYNGVVITDGLYMRGISRRWSLGQAAVLAIIAGDDLIEGPFTADQVSDVITALKQAIQDKRVSLERIDQSVQRILEMKIQYGLFK